MRFIESILYKDGIYHNLELHQKRLDNTFEQFLPDVRPTDLISTLPALSIDGTFKVRLVYDLGSGEVKHNIEYTEYIPRKIESLEVVKSPHFDYSFKYENRSIINSLVKSTKADDIIISTSGNITDGSYFNLVFWDGKAWHTPDTPLLNGVRRQKLLKEQKIRETPFTISDLGAYEKVSLINAMLDLGDLELPMNQVLK